jgi:hypothetical protein
VLAFSAIGSYLSGRISEERMTAALMKLLVVLVLLVIVYIVTLPPIFYGLVGLAREIRIVLAVVLMAPLAMVMGICRCRSEFAFWPGARPRSSHGRGA